MTSALKLNKMYPTIREYFANKTVLITGATGFVGKMIVEKLLRSCPDVSKIYVLIRPSEKQDIQQRVTQMFTLALFHQLRDKPELLGKVQAIQGDITYPKIMQNAADRENVLRNTDVVIHSAATVNFDEDLNDAVRLNLLAVDYITKFCKEMSKLQSMVHVSTAYANCYRTVVQEKIYETNISPEKMLDLYNNLSHEKLDSMAGVLKDRHPNTYTFTKCLAEKYLELNKGNLPVSIVRPSIITSAYQEPLPGWLDSWSGPAGISGFIATGLIRTVENDGSKYCDFIPVDMVSNAIIAAAWRQGITGNRKDIEVYNCANGMRNPLKWEEYVKQSTVLARKFAFSKAKVYPNCRNTTSAIYYSTKTALEEAPPVLLDWQRKLVGKKPIMQRMHKKSKSVYNVLIHFTYYSWIFQVDNLKRLHGAMSEDDKKDFYFDTAALDWDKYLEDFILGIRRHLFKDDDSTLPASREQMQRLYRQYIALHVIFGGSVAYLLYCLLFGGDNSKDEEHNYKFRERKVREFD